MWLIMAGSFDFSCSTGKKFTIYACAGGRHYFCCGFLNRDQVQLHLSPNTAFWCVLCKIYSGHILYVRPVLYDEEGSVKISIPSYVLLCLIYIHANTLRSITLTPDSHLYSKLVLLSEKIVICPAY